MSPNEKLITFNIQAYNRLDKLRIEMACVLKVTGYQGSQWPETCHPNTGQNLFHRQSAHDTKANLQLL
jgi:hypothetical protein